jgi:hypothetical protein
MCRWTIFGYTYHFLLLHTSVVIGNFDVFHAIIRPHKTNTELVVNPYAMLPFPVMFKGLQ